MARAKRPVTIAVREVQLVQGTSYLNKAEQHLALALQALAQGRRDSAVLLSVHTGISAADAVCVGRFGVRSASKTHSDQVKLLRQLLPDDDSAKRASTQLAALIDRKNTVEYEARVCTQQDAETATRHAERVVNWAREVLGRKPGA
jgi:HEPN domain-containing protein